MSSFDNTDFSWSHLGNWMPVGQDDSVNSNNVGGTVPTINTWRNLYYTYPYTVPGKYYTFDLLYFEVKRAGFLLTGGTWIVHAKTPLIGAGPKTKTRLVRYDNEGFFTVEEVLAHSTTPSATTSLNIYNSSYITALIEVPEGTLQRIGIQYYVSALPATDDELFGIPASLGSDTGLVTGMYSELYNTIEFYNVQQYPPIDSFLGTRGWGLSTVMMLKNQQANGVNGATCPSAWTTLTLNTVNTYNGRAFGTLDSNVFTIKSEGSYYIHAKCVFQGGAGGVSTRFRENGGDVLAYGTTEKSTNNADHVVSEISWCILNLSSATSYIFEARCASATGTMGAAVGTGVETYFVVSIVQFQRGPHTFRFKLPF